MLISAPGLLLRELAHARVDRAALAFARVLGARQLLEALLIAGPRADCRRLRIGAAVDAVHAVTAIVLAVTRPRHRRLALANAVVAAALAAEGLREAR